ncbi:chemotaxis protein CheW [Candidatus Magnetoovum chiemensis]|nr:chemotaxis protein CheW [Candidatus Magnetoovum chiemensis]
MDELKIDRILDKIKENEEPQNNIHAIEEEKVKLVIFTLDRTLYAFNGSDIKEILNYMDITYVPGAPNFILGIINLRGSVESVIDIRSFLNMPKAELMKNSKIAIAVNKNIHSGIIVDSIADVADVPKSSIKPVSYALDNNIKEYVFGETIYKGKSVIIISLDKIFDAFSIINQ